MKKKTEYYIKKFFLLCSGVPPSYIKPFDVWMEDKELDGWIRRKERLRSRRKFLKEKSNLKLKNYGNYNSGTGPKDAIL